MYRKKEKRCDERIVSIISHVRPVVCGKAGKRSDFGAKISFSMTCFSMTSDGFTFLDRIGWDVFNKSLDLKSQVERYRERFGYLPEAVFGDQLYGSRGNSNNRIFTGRSQAKFAFH